LQGAQKLALPYNSSQKLTVKQILSHFPLMDSGKTPKEIYAADIQKDLLLLEEQEGSVNFKFGVVYMKGGQKLDDEMLSNGNWWLKVRSVFGILEGFYQFQSTAVRSLTSFWVCWANESGSKDGSGTAVAWT
jgi:hypothetical protein